MTDTRHADDPGAASGRADLPTGTVTFLRTDVEGSMALARALGRAWDDVNEGHLAIIAGAVAAHGGTVVRTEGDALFAAFGEARAAAAAAVDAQRAIQDRERAVSGGLRVRMGLHSGEAHRAGNDYGGFEVNRAARIAGVGHGGQIIVSSTTAALIDDELPTSTRLEDLGLHRLRDVPRPERLHQLTVVGLPATFPALRTVDGVTGNLPDRLTSFVGRDTELAAIVESAGAARLLTLTGAGGIGKTSLAIEAARQLAASHPEGAWFVPLADVTDPAEVGPAIAHGIGLFDGPERPAADALLPYLGGRSLVLVLDNLEQVVDAADQVAAIVRASPGSRVIATSRAPLHVAGEHEVPVRPLGKDGVRLFTDRARAVRPGWEPGPDEPIVAEICTLLDDLPLGIELAAARIALLPPAVIRDRLAARLPLPGPGARDVPTRQRTLDSVVAWSHDMLDPGRQRLLHELAVFEGSFDVEQVDAMSASGGVSGDRLDDVLELADRSLVVAVPDAGGRARFRLLRTIQTYALGQLVVGGDEIGTRRRHAEAFLALAEGQQSGLNTSRHAAILDRIEPDFPNLRAAQRWAIDAGEGDLALRLAAQLWRYWNGFGLAVEGRRLTEAALALPSAGDATPARAWAAAALGSLAYWQADSAAARAWYEHQIEIARAVGDEACIADGLFNLAHVLWIEGGDEVDQQAYTDEVTQRYRNLGDERMEARAGWSRAILAMSHDRPAEAADYLRRAMVEFDRLDDRQYHAMSVASLGWAAFVMGDMATATRDAIRGLVESYAMRDIATTTISLHVGVLAAAMVGRFEDAAELTGAFEAACERYGVRPPAALDRFIETSDPFAATRSTLPPEVYAAAYERGRRLTLDEAVTKVTELGEAAAVVLAAGGPTG
ncbi:MAG: adenylate/guanylate cyclase domain-containing protein [Chloroflexota bacterium]|nr:adenylate/guanylate cyclase domain-containing protein [Chloroflexota bacterium]